MDRDFVHGLEQTVALFVLIAVVYSLSFLIRSKTQAQVAAFGFLLVSIVAFFQVQTTMRLACNLADDSIYGIARGVSHPIESVNAGRENENGGYLELTVRGRCIMVPSGMMRYVINARKITVYDKGTFLLE